MKKEIGLFAISISLLIFASIFISSCEKQETPVPEAEASSIQSVSGNAQSAEVGQALTNPIEVVVKDKDGKGFSGATVNFAVTEGSVSLTTTKTDASGKAKTTWTLGPTEGTQTLTVTAFKADGKTKLSGSPVTFTATANAVLEAASIELVAGGDQAAPAGDALTNPIVVLIKDQNNAGLEGVTVNFAVTEGDVSAASVTTDANGSASITWTLGTTVGTQTLTATAFKADGTTALTGSPLNVNASGTTEATGIFLFSGNGQTALVNEVLPELITFEIRDQTNSPFEGATVNFAVTEGSVSAASAITDANGKVSVTWTLGSTVGQQILTATAFKADGTTALNGSPLGISAYGTVVKSAESIVLVYGDGLTGLINSTLKNPISVDVKDQDGATFAGATVNFAVTEGTITPTSALTGAYGRAYSQWTLGPTLGTQTLTISAFKADGTTHLTGSPIILTATGVTASAGANLTDYDGNVYSTIKLANQTWMAENLKVTHYADGVVIPLISDQATWDALPRNDVSAGKAYAHYDFTVNSGYGLLYSWVGAMNLTSASNSVPSGVQGVCPTGWHLPSEAEWSELKNVLGIDAGGKLKETGTANWVAPNTGATNIIGFTALPGGAISSSGAFEGLTRRANFWTSSENSWIRGKYAELDNSDANLTLGGSSSKDYGYSVRCVKD